jgi:hypothetical protein
LAEQEPELLRICILVGQALAMLRVCALVPDLLENNHRKMDIKKEFFKHISPSE